MSAHKRERRFYMAAGAGVVQRLVQVASTLILMPLLLRTLGVAKFGIWGSASSLAWFSGLVDIGIGTALVTLIARSKASANDEEARTHLTGALTFGSAIAFLMLAVAAAAFWGFGAKAQFEPYLIAVVGLAINVPLSSANNAWMALQKGYVSGFWELIQTLLTLGGAIVASAATTNVIVFVVIVYGAMVAANAGSLLHLLIVHPELRPHRRAPFSEVRTVLHEGFLLFALNLVGGLSFLLDNVLALQLLGPEASARMTIAMRICMTGLGFLLVISQPLWPAFADAAQKLEWRWIRRNLFRGMALLTGISGVGSLVLVLSGPMLLKIWLHSSLGIGSSMLWAISAWVFAQALIRVPHLFLNAVSIMRYQIIVSALASGLALALKPFLAARFDAAGILWGTSATIGIVMVPAFLSRSLKRCSRIEKNRIREASIKSGSSQVI
jgi:O-antigen/teichoic acid export membrane protein